MKHLLILLALSQTPAPVCTTGMPPVCFNMTPVPLLTPKAACNIDALVEAIKWDLEENHKGPVQYFGGGGINGQNAIAYMDPCDDLPLSEHGVCRAEANLKYAKEERIRVAEWDKKWIDLRAELAKCEPAPKGKK